MTGEPAALLEGLVLDQQFTAAELPLLRAAVSHCAVLAGVDPESRDLLVLSVNELASQAIRRASEDGEAARLVISRTADPALTCRVIGSHATPRPCATAPQSPQPETEPEATGATGAQGFPWRLARQLSDTLRIDAGAQEPTVTVAIPGPNGTGRPRR